jgi:hypothetical protein
MVESSRTFQARLKEFLPCHSPSIPGDPVFIYFDEAHTLTSFKASSRPVISPVKPSDAGPKDVLMDVDNPSALSANPPPVMEQVITDPIPMSTSSCSDIPDDSGITRSPYDTLNSVFADLKFSGDTLCAVFLSTASKLRRLAPFEGWIISDRVTDSVSLLPPFTTTTAFDTFAIPYEDGKLTPEDVCTEGYYVTFGRPL